MRKRGLTYGFTILILGAMLGTLFGELAGLVIPEGVVREFLLRAAEAKIGPGTLDLVLFSITFGFSVKLNVVGLMGMAAAVYYLRWYA